MEKAKKAHENAVFELRAEIHALKGSLELHSSSLKGGALRGSMAKRGDSKLEGSSDNSSQRSYKGEAGDNIFHESQGDDELQSDRHQALNDMVEIEDMDPDYDQKGGDLIQAN